MTNAEPIQNHLPFEKEWQARTSRTCRGHLPSCLFFMGLLIYLLTRFINLPDFPIYFFTDEAIQSQQAADLIANNFRGPDNTFFPVYFQNGGRYNLSLSVYAQVLPTLIFGKSVWVTRGVSVLVSLAAPIFLAWMLRDIFQKHTWWLAPLLLAVTPAWFLHSRTAFETVMMSSMYGGFLYSYLRYRQGKPHFLFPALIFGAFAFYAYSPGQVIMVVSGVLLLILDARYHWQNRQTTLAGLGLLVLLALPYLHFSLTQSQSPAAQLTLLNAYWAKPMPLIEKLGMYFSRYLKGFNPLYWFWPRPSFIEQFAPQITLPSWLFSNQLDLERHTMKGYGHILLAALPFWVTGLARTIKRFKHPAYQALLVAVLAAPSGAALVDWGITRGLVFLIPATLFTAMGLDAGFNWLRKKLPNIRYSHLSLAALAAFSVLSFWMLADSLNNGPTWYSDYGLNGMQYGGRQVFTRAAEIARANPEREILISSTWTNGADVVMRYFTGDLPNVKMGNINAFGLQKHPLDRSMLFIMTQEDLQWIRESGKFKGVTIEEKLPYPDGSDGFYFVSLAYVKNIDDILAAERAARQDPLFETITFLEQEVSIQYPALDMNEIGHAFDGDTTTLIRTLEANPMKVQITFPLPIRVTRVRVVVGGTPTRVKVSALAGGENLAELMQQVGASAKKRELVLSLQEPLTVDSLVIEVLNSNDGETAHVHLWEVFID